MKNDKSLSFYSLSIWVLASLFMFYKYILQNFPSVMTLELMQAFHVESLGLGMLSSAYFWTYLVVPLFAGILLDRLGVRWISGFAIAIAGAGLFIFAESKSIHGAILGRVCMGIGASFATLTYFKIAADWFSEKWYSLLTAILVSIGMLGAIVGQTPLAWFTHQHGWQQSLFALSAFGLGISFVFLLIIRDKKPDYALGHHPMNMKNDLLKIIKNKQNWLMTAYSGLSFAPVVIFCGLWGNPFLQICHQLDELTAPSVISLVFVGLALGSPLFAFIEHRISNRIKVMMLSTFLSALSMVVIIFIHPLPVSVLSLLLFSFGLFLGPFPWIFVIGKEQNPIYLAGTVISMINASDAFFDALTEPLIGKILDMFSNATYTYQIALMILPLYQLIGVFCLKKIKLDAHED